MNKKYVTKLFLSITISMAACPLAWADQPTPTMDTITVTAERFPVEEKETPRFVTILSKEQLVETGASNLVTALRKSGGLGYKAFGPLGIGHGGMNSELPMRGVYGGELVLVNGVPIQSAAGASYDLDTIPLNQIERVEILKGAAATLYGADAMSGVINIITKRNGEKSKGFQVTGGDYEYAEGNVYYNSPLLNLGVNYQHLGGLSKISQNFSRNYHYDTGDTNRYGVSASLAPTDHLFVDLQGSFYDTEYLKVNDDGTLASGTDQEDTKLMTTVRYETESLHAKVFYNSGEMRREEFTNPSKEVDRNRNMNAGFGADYRFGFDWAELTTGADYVYRSADYSTKYGYHYRNDYALFAQMKKEFAKKLTITMGAREQFIDGESGTDDYDRFLPSLGLSWAATDSLSLFANTGKAFRAPTFNNRYYSSSFMVGNPNVGPEEGWTYETGVKYDHALINLRLALFHMAYEDKIEIDRSNGYPLTYFNAGDYQSSGIEWQIGLTPFAHRSDSLAGLGLNWAGYSAEPIAEDPAGEKYQPGAKFQSSVGLSYLGEKLTANLDVNILASREYNLDDITTVDLYGKYPLAGGHLSVTIENIFDDEVQVSGKMDEDASTRYAYYGMGRLFKVGYEMQF
ncbi:MAG: TonB-dependent receptor [Desulfobulbaceae bacterium]|jgi:outer membrane cobalamin receptor|nr:TonB-dependent receptor [Desulfobulbaceae bacterium]